MTKFGWYTTLDGGDKLVHPKYYKYDNGNDESLSKEKKIYNTWVQNANENFINIK